MKPEILVGTKGIKHYLINDFSFDSISIELPKPQETEDAEFEVILNELKELGMSDITNDLLDLGISVEHIDENGNKKRIVPNSDEWLKALKLLPEPNNKKK